MATKTQTPSKPAEEKNQQYDGIYDTQVPQQTPSIRATINRVFDDENSRVRASASLTIGGSFAVHGVKVINGSKGDFVQMPSVKLGDGTYKDTFHAVTAEARQQMNDAVMSAYEQKLTEIQTQTQTQAQTSAPSEQPTMRMA